MPTVLSHRVLVGCALLSLGVSAAWAAEPQAARPHIRSVVVDATTTPGRLTISGQQLGTLAPTVTLNDQPLTVTSFSPGLVTAQVPASITAGSYLLSVSPNGQAEQTLQFDVTLGAVGPQGPVGPPGPAGAPSDAGALFTTIVASRSLPALQQTEVAALTVPPGTYWVVFTTVVATPVLANAVIGVECDLGTVDAQPNTVVLLPGPLHLDAASLSAQGVASFSTQTRISAVCGATDNTTGANPAAGISTGRLTALRVASIN